MSIGRATGPLVVGPGQGDRVDLGGLGVDFKIWGELTGGALSVVEHPMEPRRLVPPHLHEAEDELSYVCEGTFGVRIGDYEAQAGPGSYIYKPRGVPHTFWNPTDRPARLVELIFPAGFEGFFASLAELAARAEPPAQFAALREELGARYRLRFAEPGWVAELSARYGLKPLGEP